MYFLALIGPVEADPEYQLIVDSNNLIMEIDNEISKPLTVVTKIVKVPCPQAFQCIVLKSWE